MTDKLKEIQIKIETLTESKTLCVLPWIHFATLETGFTIFDRPTVCISESCVSSQTAKFLKGKINV
jgi:hypothetical protein